MTHDHRNIEALRQENQRLREHIDELVLERDYWKHQTPETTLSSTAAHVLHPYLSGPVVLFKWAAREGWSVEYVSPNISRFGYTADDFISGRISYLSIVHPDDVQRITEEIIQYSTEGHTDFEQDYRIFNAAGEPRAIYDYTTILRDNDGTITHYVGYVLDITERKQIEQRLQESEERLRFILAGSRDGAWDTNLITGETYYSPRYAEMLGYHLVELEPFMETWINAIHPDDKPEVMQLFQDYLHGKLTEYAYEHRLRHKSGEWIWILSRGQVIERTADGQPLRMAGTITDITERKQAESAMYEQQENYRSLVEAIEDWIWEVNSEGVYTYTSPGVTEIMGYLPEDVIGKTPFDFMSPDEAQRVGAIFQDVISQQLPLHRFENRLIRKDGHEVIVETSGVPFFASDGTMRGYRGVDHNVTEQRQMEAERATLHEHVIAAQRDALRELSTPLLPLSEHVLAMPLVGTLDSSRAQQLMETLLEGIAAHQAEFAIIDITGVKVVDTQVAQGFIQAAQAVRLLGAQVILTGIQPQIAQTLVHLGADMSGIITRSTLQSGIIYALSEQGIV